MDRAHLILFVLALTFVAIFSFSAGKLDRPPSPPSPTPSASPSAVPVTPTPEPVVTQAISPPLTSPTLSPVPTPTATNWQTYTNPNYNYSLNYPDPCLSGPLPGYCKQDPPDQRPPECLCFLNGTDPDSLIIQTYTGVSPNLTLATFSLSHLSTLAYNPPAGTDLITWLNANFSFQNIPPATNIQIDGLPAAEVYTPQSPGAYSQKDVYFLQNDLLFHISMVDVDNQANQDLYNQILSSLIFN